MIRKLTVPVLLAILGTLIAGQAFGQWAVPPPQSTARPPFDQVMAGRGLRGPGTGLPALRLAAERPTRVPNQVVVKYNKALRQPTVAKLATKQPVRVISAIPQLDVQVLEVADVDSAIAQLRRDPNVAWAAPRLFRYPLIANPNDPAYNDYDYLLPTEPDTATWYKWDSHMINCVLGWSMWPNRYYSASSPKGSDAVILAVIDTGIDYGHPDFINQGGTGTSVDQGGQLLRSLDASIFSGVVTPEAPDGYGHGTHVAGIAAAATNNGVGTVGTGYNANILSLRVIDAAGYGTDSDIAQAIVYAVDHGALILNLSLGSYEYSQVEQDAVNYAWRKNVLVVAAAGNDGSDKLNYPAAMSKVLTVAATSRTSAATYSNYGNFVGIAAPGGDFDFEIMWLLGVYSTMPTYYVTLNDPVTYGAAQNYDYLMGTSMAAPHVAGLAAIYAGLKGINRSTPGGNLMMYQAIQRAADGTGGWDPYFGYGLIDVFRTTNLDYDPNPRGDTVGCITGQVRYRGTPVQNASISAKLVGGTSTFTASSRSDGGYRVMNIPEGVYTVSATFFGETLKLNNVVVTAGCDIPGQDFNIGAFPSAITVDDAIGVQGTPVTLRAHFTRTDTNEPVEDIRLFFGVDGTELGSAITDALGTAEYLYQVPETMPQGDHSIDVNYFGDAAYKSASGTGTLHLPGAVDTTMYVPDRVGTITEMVILRAFLMRVGDGARIPDKPVQFSVDGTPVGTATTDSNGRASLEWVITDGPPTRTLTGAFAGDALNSPSSGNGTLSAQSFGTKLYGEDREGRITSYRLLTAHLYRTDNTPIYNKLISFSVDGTLIGTDRTRTTGRANVGYTIPAGSGAGTRTIRAEWAGDGGYAPASATNTLTVSRALPYIWVMPRSVAQGGVARMYAYFRRLADYQPQSGKTVTFSVDGTPVQTVVTDAAGIARYQYTTVEAPGIHTMRCEFAGDAWVEPGYGEASLTIY
jgi:subtilisin family serine protease